MSLSTKNGSTKKKNPIKTEYFNKYILLCDDDEENKY